MGELGVRDFEIPSRCGRQNNSRGNSMCSGHHVSANPAGPSRGLLFASNPHKRESLVIWTFRGKKTRDSEQRHLDIPDIDVHHGTSSNWSKEAKEEVVCSARVDAQTMFSC